jgi:transcriptional regulator with XRE-family HTH domain
MSHAQRVSKIQVTEWVRDWLEKERAKSGDISYRELAARFGVSHAALQTVAIGARNVGHDLEQAFADRLFRGSVDKLRAEAARAWVERHGDELAIDEFPHREDALRRLRGLISSQTRKTIESMSPDHDLSVIEWIELAIDEHRRETRLARVGGGVVRGKGRDAAQTR